MFPNASPLPEGTSLLDAKEITENPPPLHCVGLLFLLAPFFYGYGTSLIAESSTVLNLSVGALLAYANSVTVVLIAILVGKSVLVGTSQNEKRRRYIYMAGRTLEAVLLGLGIFFVVDAKAKYIVDRDNSTTTKTGAEVANFYFYQLAMLSLGIASLPFCYELRTGGETNPRKLNVPVFLANIGLFGYTALAIGSFYELFQAVFLCMIDDAEGMTDRGQIGIYFCAPGGLFELALGLLWIYRGSTTVSH